MSIALKYLLSWIENHIGTEKINCNIYKTDDRI